MVHCISAERQSVAAPSHIALGQTQAPATATRSEIVAAHSRDELGQQAQAPATATRKQSVAAPRHDALGQAQAPATATREQSVAAPSHIAHGQARAPATATRKQSIAAPSHIALVQAQVCICQFYEGSKRCRTQPWYSLLLISLAPLKSYIHYLHRICL